MNYTKGEWNKNKHGFIITTDNGLKVIADCYSFIPQLTRPRFIEAQHNAHLISAAPDMYKALKALLLNREIGEYESQKLGLPRMMEVNDAARKALAKAEGKDVEIHKETTES